MKIWIVFPLVVTFWPFLCRTQYEGREIQGRFDPIGNSLEDEFELPPPSNDAEKDFQNAILAQMRNPDGSLKEEGELDLLKFDEFMVWESEDRKPKRSGGRHDDFNYVNDANWWDEWKAENFPQLAQMPSKNWKIPDLDTSESVIKPTQIGQTWYQKSKNKRGLVKIPFMISRKFESWKTTVIKKALNHLMQFSCLQFVEKFALGDDMLLFTPGKANEPDLCYSVLFRRSHVIWSKQYQRYYSAQKVNLGHGCFNGGGYTTAVHETLHALGFIHEQKRPDRDYYVKINKKNIPKDLWPQFEKEKHYSVNTYGYGYDFFSVMHYVNDAFSDQNGEIYDSCKKKWVPGRLPSIEALPKWYHLVYNDYGCGRFGIQECGESCSFTTSTDRKKLRTAYRCRKGYGPREYLYVPTSREFDVPEEILKASRQPSGPYFEIRDEYKNISREIPDEDFDPEYWRLENEDPDY